MSASPGIAQDHRLPSSISYRWRVAVNWECEPCDPENPDHWTDMGVWFGTRAAAVEELKSLAPTLSPSVKYELDDGSEIDILFEWKRDVEMFDPDRPTVLTLVGWADHVDIDGALVGIIEHERRVEFTAEAVCAGGSNRLAADPETDAGDADRRRR